MEAFLASVAVHVHLDVLPHILQRCDASLETDGRLFNSSTTTLAGDQWLLDDLYPVSSFSR